MKYCLAELWGAVTLVAVLFAGLRYVYGNPAAIIGAMIMAWPVHGIVCDVVERMIMKGKRGKRVI